jgi:uncharacterized protein (DUF433 family)
MPATSWIEKTLDVCGGSARIRATRHTVHGLVQWRREGLSDDAILDYYPELTREDLAAAWQYYDTHREEIDQAIREDEEA